MNVRRLLENTVVAFAAQGLSLLVSVALALLVPKVLGVEEFGYWQLFIFYVNYVGLFHLGLDDGVYLLMGGIPRERIDKRSVNSQFWYGLSFQLVFAGAIAVAALLGGFGEQRSFVLMATALFLLLNNAAFYLGYVFQAMNETQTYSLSVMVDRVLFCIPLLVMVALRVDSFEPYVVSYAVSKTCSLAYCLWHARDILASGLLAPRLAFGEIGASIKVGSSLMFANAAEMLIIGVVRFAIDGVWGIETFGQVSLALSLVNFFSTFAIQLGMVLFPALRQSSDAERRSFYRVARDAMETLLPGVYVLYFPISWALAAWLPQYTDSFRYLALLLPLCVFDGKMSVCSTTFFKTLRKERVLLAINAASVAVSCLVTFLCVGVVGSLEAVLLGVTAVIVARSLVAEVWLNGRLGVFGGTLALQELVLTAFYLMVAIASGTLIGFVLYTLGYAAFLVANRKVVRELVQRVRGALSR